MREGDVVLIRQQKTGKLVTPFDPKPYRVIAVKGTMVTVQRHGHVVTRNQSFFKLLKHQPELPLTPESESEEDDDGPMQADQQHPAQPGHMPQAVSRYPRRMNRQAPQRLLFDM